MHKVHLVNPTYETWNPPCGTANLASTTNIPSEVTCKKCKRLIPSDKPLKMYCVSVYDEQKYIEASNASKANYQAFKEFYYNNDMCESIGEQFSWFKSRLESTRVCKDKNVQKTLTHAEKDAIEEQKAIDECEEWNKKYPIGTQVWFQKDGAEKPILTKTRSEAQSRGTYMVLWTEADGSSYRLDPRWILPYVGNENIKVLRN